MTSSRRNATTCSIGQMIVAALLAAGCGGGSDVTAPPAPQLVASVEITPSPATVAVGGTMQLTAVTKASDGTVLTGRAIAWTTSSEAVATVNGTGQVTGVAAGAVTITATNEEASGAAALSVTAAAPPPPPPTGFEIRTPDIEIQPMQEVSYCYYFRTPNTEPVAVRQWRSQMTAGGRDVRLVLTSSDIHPPGTVSVVNCGAVGAIPVTAYVAHQPVAEFTFPADDGSGRPVGQIIPPNQSGYLRVHYQNPSPDQPISVAVEVEAVGYAANTAVTRADPYVAYTGDISIPPKSSGSAVDTCQTPSGAQFFSMSTYSHKFSVHTYIKHGDAVVFESTDFANPGSGTWNAPFFSFASGKLTYQCDYVNPLNLTIRTGNSHQYEEECIAFAYYFPSTGPGVCYNGTILTPSVQPAVPSAAVGSART